MILGALLVALVGVAGPRGGWAWGAAGHEWVSGIAIEKLPDSLPAFIRTPEAAAEIAVLDRSKGAGKSHDAERDPGHYIDLFDNGDVMGGLPLAKLPRDARGLRAHLVRSRQGAARTPHRPQHRDLEPLYLATRRSPYT